MCVSVYFIDAHSNPKYHKRMTTKHLTTKEVAKRLGITIRRVQAMISDKRLPARRREGEWKIKETDLLTVADRKPGRPPNEKSSQATNAKPRV